MKRTQRDEPPRPCFVYMIIDYASAWPSLRFLITTITLNAGGNGHNSYSLKDRQGNADGNNTVTCKCKHHILQCVEYTIAGRICCTVVAADWNKTVSEDFENRKK